MAPASMRRCNCANKDDRRLNLDLSREVALVTGASRGIGRAIACELGAAGATVAGTATTDAGAQAITDGFAGRGIKGRGFRLDVTDANRILMIVDEVKKAFGIITILVNNAGVTRDGLAVKLADQDWDLVLETNLTATHRVTKACLRDMMRARHGRIINVGSVIGSTGNAGQVNYAASKAGLVGYSKALAREIAGREITVNTIAPGYIRTDMTSELSEDQVSALCAQIPLHRIGSVDDVASATLFLVSPAAGYITGQTLHVNGGMFMN